MKIINCGGIHRELAIPSAPKKASPFWRKPDGTQVFVRVLKDVLDNRFTLLCDLSLAELSTTIPLTLIGPPGIWVVLPSSVKGVFKATEGVWEELDERKGGYRPAKSNPLTIAAGMAGAVQQHLAQDGAIAPSVEPAVFFVDPGAHVDSFKSIVRIILADGLLRFAGSLLQARQVLDKEEIQSLIDSLLGEGWQELMDRQSEKPDFYSLREPPPPKEPKPPSRMVAISRQEPEAIRRLYRFFHFTRKQWLLLGFLFLLCLMVLITLVILVLISA